jgi:glycerol-3-phosphate dehydrogenase
MPESIREFAALAAEPLDVLVIGGGIVGAGVARDAAMRGLRIGLVEKHDFASGTSGRSSRLLHGGLRYLAQGRLGLVYEASHEKMVLHRIAPHLAAPLAFVFPTYRHTAWPRWKLSVGVKLYDLLCGRHNLGRSQTLGPAAVREMLPGLVDKDLTGAVRYYDGFTNDARLVLDTLGSAARHGAIVLNYAELHDAAADGAGWRCGIHDMLGGTEIEVKARSVVNAAGPWAGGIPHSRLRLRLTKGVHLVIDARRLPIPDAVVMTAGSRILFAIPWGERVILGTTDTDFSGAIEAVAADESDVAYILEIVNRHFPAAALTPADVVSTWAGVRPLIATGHGGPSDISRAHQILMPEPGWFDVAGGKLTTYRLIAEQAVDRIVAYQGRRAQPCRTAIEPLLTDSSNPAASGLFPPLAEQKLVEHFCHNEWAVHLDDVMLRRAGWHYYHADSASIATRVAGWMAAIHGWDPARLAEEIARLPGS